MTKIPLLFFAAAFCLPAIADEASLQQINSEGGEIVLGGSVPGILEVEAPAFSLLEDTNANSVAAASHVGEGKVIALSHGGFLVGKDIGDQESFQKFLKNAIAWVTDHKKNPKIAVAPGAAAVVPALKNIGLSAEVIAADQIGTDLDLYLVKGESSQALPAAGITKLKAHLKQGGGVIVAATPWPFGGRFPDFSTFPPNQITADFGIQFQSNGYASNKRPLIISDGTDQSPIIAAEKLKSSVTPEAVAELRKGVFLKGTNLDRFIAALKELNEAVGPVIPSKESPVIPGENPLFDAIIETETTLNLRLPAGEMYAIPAAGNYPGEVPVDAPTTQVGINLDATYKGWATGRNAGGWAAGEMRPTGIYARPGVPVVVTVPDSLVGQGFEVVIGSYNGGLDNRKKWERYPKLQRSFPIKKGQTSASNGLGGLVTIRVPRDARFPSQKISISGGVRAPLYVHGETTVEDWKNQIRNYPAPWAELASNRMIIALPSDHIRDLDDPDKVMEIWNSYIEKAAELAVLDRDQYRAERIVFDRQTAAGSMHSGYPVAAHLGGASAKAVDSKALTEEGDWGFFHEYGHNHQHNLWSLPGTGETTCNLWSVYLFEELIGKNRDNTHGAIKPLTRKTRVNKYFADGADFEKNWSMWNALDTYLLIQEAFGWEPFKKVFAEYNKLPESEWPKSQQEKNDQFVIRLSKACGKNLAPFWRKWNLPLTDAVDKELSGLEVWVSRDIPG